MSELKPVIPTTHSKLVAFNTCPYRFYRQFVAQDIVEDSSEALAFGNREHSWLEGYFKRNGYMPARMDFMKNVLDKFSERIRGRGGVITPELALAIDTNYQPTKWYGVPDILFRAKLDLDAKVGSDCILVDYKTGKPKEDVTQLQRYTLVRMLHDPTIERVRPEFWFMRYGQEEEKPVIGMKRVGLVPDLQSEDNWITRDDLPTIQRQLSEDIEFLQHSETNADWPTEPSMPFPCGYCPVKECVHYDPVRKN